ESGEERTELINIHHLMVELKKQNPNFGLVPWGSHSSDPHTVTWVLSLLPVVSEASTLLTQPPLQSSASTECAQGGFFLDF
ncbi:hypothetical protein HispidOSU_003608, partial [Sigmodon hispidus]